jgi:protein-L-isoaspartate(D-aspartate) O-methyltransferase
MTMLALQDQDAPGTDFAAARRMMVLGQLTPNQVSDPLLLQAMGEVPRELFVPPAARHRAYADEAVPLGSGRAMMTPMAIGRLLQSLQPQPGERALVLGAGTGYGAAILARMDLDVVAIESDAALVALGKAALDFALAGHRPLLRQGDPLKGWPVGAPFRVILIEGGIERVPSELWAQMGEGGRAAAIRQGGAPSGGRVGRAALFRRVGGTVTETAGFDAVAPVLPEFRAAPGFVF